MHLTLDNTFTVHYIKVVSILAVQFCHDSYLDFSSLTQTPSCENNLVAQIREFHARFSITLIIKSLQMANTFLWHKLRAACVPSQPKSRTMRMQMC